MLHKVTSEQELLQFGVRAELACRRHALSFIAQSRQEDVLHSAFRFVLHSRLAQFQLLLELLPFSSIINEIIDFISCFLFEFK